MIIAIEGIDGAGKSLQFQLLRERLAGNILELSFPRYETLLGREIGAMLRGESGVSADKQDARSMALWYAADRAVCFQGLDLSGYEHVLLNRYTLANVVYQSLRMPANERESFCDWVFRLEHEEFGIPRPDRYIILDMDTKNSTENIRKKGSREYIDAREDVYESDKAFQDGVRGLYRRFADELENAALIECARDGELRPPVEINAEIAAAIGI